MSDNGGLSAGAIAGIAVGFTLFGILFTWNYVRAFRKRQYSAGARSYRDLETEYQRLLDERDQRLDVEVRKRKVEEEDSTSGSQIWFSRYVHHGNLKHWVLVVDGSKYELRRDHNTGRYVHHIADWTIDQEKREAALAELKIPETDGYYICLIGWTRLDATQLRDICGQVMGQFGSYNLLWNNCQDFLQQFADRIISKKALDWSWFRMHSKTEYQADQALPPTPEEIIARQRAMMINQQQQANPQQILQNNINLMNQQLAMQNSQLNAINQSMVNQNNLMMTNPAMNPGMNPGIMGGM